MARTPVSSLAVDAFLSNVVLGLYATARGESPSNFPLAVISDLTAVHEVLTQPSVFAKSLGLLGDWGDSRFNTNGTEWELRRALTQRAYLTAGADHNAGKIGNVYKASLDRAEPDLESIHRGLMLAASRCFFAAFDCVVDFDRLLALFERSRALVKRLQFFTWHSPSASEIDALREEAKAIAQNFEAEGRQSPAFRELLASFQDRAIGIDDFDPVHELLMNFFAGIETTAATLCFAIDRLGVDDRVQQRIHDEVSLGEETKYLDCFLMETLRYFPTIPFVVREAAEPTMLGPLVLEKGQPFLVSIVGLHHDAKSWKDPEIFDASRSEFIDNSYDRRAFMPFSAGPRMCGGARLANLELREGLRAFVRAFEVRNDSENVGFDYGISLRPRAVGNISIRRRSAAA